MPRAVIVHKEGPFQDCTIETVPPLVANEGNAVVKVLACGVAFPDVLTILGKHVSRAIPPFVPCSEICGEVTAIGPGQKHCEQHQLGDLPCMMLSRAAGCRC